MTDNKQEGKVKLRVDSWSNCFIFVFFVFFLFNLWQTVHERWLVEQIIDPETGSMSVEFHAEYIALGLVGIAVLVGIWAIRRRETTWRFLRSTRLGIVLITSVLVGTVFGTLIFQNASPQDYVNFYSPRGLLWLGGGIGVAAIIANSPIDQHFRDWYQEDVRSGTSDRLRSTPTCFGFTPSRSSRSATVKGPGKFRSSPLMRRRRTGSRSWDMLLQVGSPPGPSPPARGGRPSGIPTRAG